MTQAPIDELIKQCHSIYKLVVIAARRAKELSQGAPKLVQIDLKKVTSIALEVIRQGKIQLKPVEGEEEPARRKGRAKREKDEETATAGAKKKKS